MKYRDLELDKENCFVLMKGQELHLTSTEYKVASLSDGKQRQDCYKGDAFGTALGCGGKLRR